MPIEYEFVKLEEGTERDTLTVKIIRKPSWLERKLLRQEESSRETQYVGRSSVWYEQDSYKRVDAELERVLSGFYLRGKEENKRRQQHGT